MAGLVARQLDIDLSQVGFESATEIQMVLRRATVADSFIIIPENFRVKTELEGGIGKAELLPTTYGSVYECTLLDTSRNKLAQFFFEMPNENSELADLIKLTAWPVDDGSVSVPSKLINLTDVVEGAPDSAAGKYLTEIAPVGGERRFSFRSVLAENVSGLSELQAQVDLKLDAADYNDRFLGLFASFFELEAAHPTASAGDYAQVDLGIGSDVIIYAWDVSDAKWAAIGVSTISTTDDVPEGSSNLYLTGQRVRDTPLTGLSTASATPITATDTVLVAAGKLQRQATDIEAKLATIQEGATANATNAQLRDRATHTGTQAVNTITGLAIVATSGSYNDLSDKPTIGTNAETLNGQNGVFYLSRANHTGTQAISTVTGLQAALDGKLESVAWGEITGTLSDQTDLQGALNLKLDAADYNDRFLGLFLSVFDLEAAHPTASAGDYAQVDFGIGADVIVYFYDVSDAQWMPVGSSSIANTDALPEGSSNLYLTGQRVRDTPLTGLSTASATPITSTDSVLSAAAKLQAQINAGGGAAGGGAAWGEITGTLSAQTDLQAAFNLKLDAAAYNDRFLGLFSSVFDLEAAHPTASAGDYAQVDLGIGAEVIVYFYDVSDAQWMPVGSSSIANTDALPEGSSNLYHTTQRVRDTTLTGLSVATATPITSADTVLSAAGKLQRQATDNAALLPPLFDTAWYGSGSYYDAVYPYYTIIAPTSGLLLGRLYFNKRKILDAVTFNELSVNVTTAAASSNVFYGVYASDANGLPSTLLASGSASGATTGVKSTAVTLALTKGQVVWDAYLNTGAAVGVTAFQPIFQGGAVSPTANGTVMLMRTAASLPADASIGAFTLLTASRIPRVALRAA